jgi:hypothetical protein
MNSIQVIVGNVITQQTTPVGVIENDHVIKNASAAPTQAKTGPMPRNHRFRLDDYQVVLPCRPKLDEM